MLKPRLLLLVPLALVTLAITGCTKEIDKGKAENLVRQAVKNGGRTSVKSVSCPSGVKVKKGGTFTCQLSLADGTSGTITIHMIDDNGKIQIYGPSDFQVQ